MPEPEMKNEDPFSDLSSDSSGGTAVSDKKEYPGVHSKLSVKEGDEYITKGHLNLWAGKEGNLTGNIRLFGPDGGVEKTQVEKLSQGADKNGKPFIGGFVKRENGPDLYIRINMSKTKPNEESPEGKDFLSAQVSSVSGEGESKVFSPIGQGYVNGNSALAEQFLGASKPGAKMPATVMAFRHVLPSDDKLFGDLVMNEAKEAVAAKAKSKAPSPSV